MWSFFVVLDQPAIGTTEKPNLLCPNNHEVGTEVSGCWSPQFAQLSAELVRESSGTL